MQSSDLASLAPHKSGLLSLIHSKPLVMCGFFAAALSLHGCSAPQKAPEVSKAPVVEPPKIKIAPLEPVETIQSYNPQQARSQALDKEDWLTYLQLSNELWLEANPTTQQVIEAEVWQAIQSLNPQVLFNLETNETDIFAWAELVNLRQSSGFSQITARLNLHTFYAGSPPTERLLSQVLTSLPTQSHPQTIAVLLPETGKYQPVGRFIKKGIIKRYFYDQQSQHPFPPVRLKFYDSSDVTLALSLYQQAKQDGAEVIIGPVQKEAIRALSEIEDPNLITLNTIEVPTAFAQYNLRQNQPLSDLILGLQSQNFTTLALIGSDQAEQKSLADQLQSAWLSSPQHHLVRFHYAEKNFNYRAALGQLVNEVDSQERKNTLRWIVGKPIQYFPRVRQDLDAIVMLDKPSRVAVFNPQLEFYQLKLPVFATQNLRSSKLVQTQAQPDLADITLLNPPYAYHPQGLKNQFEAFGWDSFLLAMHLPQLRQGACLKATKNGILSLENNRVKQQLVWTQYQKNGRLRPYQLPSVQLDAPSKLEVTFDPNTLPQYEDLYTSPTNKPQQADNVVTQ